MSSNINKYLPQHDIQVDRHRRIYANTIGNAAYGWQWTAKATTSASPSTAHNEYRHAEK